MMGCIDIPMELDDYLGPTGMTEGRLDIHGLTVIMGFRDTPPEVFSQFRKIFINTWEDLPEQDRNIIALGFQEMSNKLPLLNIRGGIWLLPSVNSKAQAYVSGFGGLMVFDSYWFQERESDRLYRHTIRHELAHVWQHATGMCNGCLGYDHLESIADWMATYWLIKNDWRPVSVTTDSSDKGGDTT
ncbi:MAG: hypothetical protein ABFD49_11805 [Armatimonadota bacterium]|nr:basic secretory family protein [bacterium]